MGLIRKVASIMMLGGVSSHTRHEPPGKAERARALHEDEAHRQADLSEVAEKEAEAVPEWPPGPDSGWKHAGTGRWACTAVRWVE
ncbi:MAG: hypothetical protein WBQ71_20925 [Trebonia sp.]